MMLKEQRENVAVLGQGYVGLELSVTLLNNGFTVYGIDVSRERIETLKSGISPVENVKSSSIGLHLESRKYIPSTNFGLVKDCSIVVICVPTPLDDIGEPDLSYLLDAISQVAPSISPGTLIVNESTSFPGTLRKIVMKQLLNSRSDLVGKLNFGTAPERISPGNLIPLSKVPRVVSGITEECLVRTAEFYSEFCELVHTVSTSEVAEMSKLLENSFRQVNISFINEFNLICRKLEIDTSEVIKAANTKPYGFMTFFPSAGIGGHCIPVDPIYLNYAAKEVGQKSQFIELANEINRSHSTRLCELVLKIEDCKQPANILVLGVAYKPGLTDCRESPAADIIDYFRSCGHNVKWHDPLVSEFNGEASSDINENFSFAVMVTAQPNMNLADLYLNGVKIYDFSHSEAYSRFTIHI